MIMHEVALDNLVQKVSLVAPGPGDPAHRSLALLLGLLHLADCDGQRRRAAGFALNALQFRS